MKSKFILFTMILIISTFLFTSVYANSGPWKYEPSPGFNAVPMKSNSVEVLKENLSFDLCKTERPDISLTTASYTLKNNSDKDEKFQTAFPYVGSTINFSPSYKDYREISVKLDGVEINKNIKILPDTLFESTNGVGGKGIYRKDNKPITFENILSSINSAIDEKDFNLDKFLSDNYNKYPDIYSAGDFVQVILFELNLKANSTHQLDITYYQLAGGDRTKTGTKDYTYKYFYFLEPAKYWKQFNNLSISVKTPIGCNIKESNLKLTESSEKGVYLGHFDNLPDSNFEFDIDFDKFVSVKMNIIFIILSLFAAIITVTTLISYYRRRRQAKTN